MKGFINNEVDRNNLNFLINASQETIKDWYRTCTVDDVNYARELMDAYALEVREMALEIRTECELELMTKYDDALNVIRLVKEK